MITTTYVRYLDDGTVQWRDPADPLKDEWNTFHGTNTQLVALIANLRKEARRDDPKHPLTRLEAEEEAHNESNRSESRRTEKRDHRAQGAEQPGLLNHGELP